MEGSLDDPPLVLRNSRGKLAQALLVCLVIVALAIIMLVEPNPTPKAEAISRMCIIVFGCFAPLGAIRLVWPDRLELSPAGLAYCSVLSRQFDIAWDELRDVRVRDFRGSRTVVFDVSPSARARVKPSRLNRWITGADIGLSSAWPLRPEAMVELLYDAKSRWA